MVTAEKDRRGQGQMNKRRTKRVKRTIDRKRDERR
jgi:hypothetical protein